jgi:2-dehydropantoate 2-reductase
MRAPVTERLRMKRADFDFAILGAGAIGSILGAHLARAGHSVVMLARDRRAEQIQKDGLRITGLAELSERVPTLTDGEKLRSARVLIVAMKALGTADALAALRHADVESTFSIQNGVLKNELLAAVFGEPRVLGALANISGEMLPGGEIVFTRNVAIQLGELHGEVQGDASSRAQHIANTLNTSGIRAAAVVNIQNLEWSKFVAWAGLMALAVTVRTETWRYLTNTGSAVVLVRLVREMANLALALGIELTDDSVLPVATISAATEADAIAAVVKVGRILQVNAPTHRVSSLQDLDAGRPLEIHETLGSALQQAARRGLTLPLVESFYHLIAAIDGQRSER